MFRKITFILLLVFCFSISEVFAEDYFINENGIKLTQKELNFVNEFYGDGFFYKMNIDDYEWISDLKINENNVEIVYFLENNMNTFSLYDMTHVTNSKKLSVAKSCSSTCTIITNLSWLKNPFIKSYDVIGARFENTYLINNSDIITKITSNKGTEYSSNNKIMSNGFGTSVKLPSGSKDISVQQKIYTKLGGRVYASYQHSASIISLNTSLMFNISSNGSGNVFDFYGSAAGKFDNMNGVYIDL